MKKYLRVLLLEDDPDDAVLIRHELERSDFRVEVHRVETPTAYLNALRARPDLILADYHLPQFDAMQALALLQEQDLDIPFIIVSGALGEELAVAALRQGAADYLLKDRLARLGEAIRRALHEQELRRQKQRAEDELKQQTVFLRQVIDTIPHLIFVKDRAGRFTLVNQAVADAYDSTVEDLKGKTDAETRATPEEIARFHRDDLEVMDSGVEKVIPELEIVDAGGSRHILQVFKRPIADSDGRINHVLALGVDITERKHYEAALLEAKQRAEELSRLKSSFLACMSHEIRTPLSAITGVADLLLDEVSPAQQELVKLIQAGASRLLETLTSVLDLTQLEGGSLQMRPETFDLVEQVRTTVPLFREQALQKRLSLSLALPEEPIEVEQDRAAVNRVLMNLISNAVRFTKEGGVVVGVEARGPAVTIRVTDTGIGISEVFLPHLFEEFRQESSGLARTHEGSGLGLSITKRLVELMGGEISVESERGKGSTFTVRLPRRVSDAGPVEEPHAVRDTTGAPPDEAAMPRVGADRPPGEASKTRDEAGTFPREADAAKGKTNGEERKPAVSQAGARKRRILVVEDDKSTRFVLKRMLEKQYEVATASSVDEALEKAGATAFDALMLDINLGEQRTGEDLLHELRNWPEYKRVPAVACTAYGLPEDREQFLAKGFDEFISKPFSWKKLLETLQVAFDKPAGVEAEVKPVRKTEMKLPPLPGNLSEIMEVLSGTSVSPDMERLQVVLATDPIMASWVLSHVNSAYFSVRGEVSSLDRALTLLGVRPVCNLVLMKILTEVFADVGTARSQRVYKHLMTISIATAAFARNLAQNVKLPDPERAFTGGLLHQAGRLVLLSNNPGSYADLWYSMGEAASAGALTTPSLKLERHRFETDAIELGTMLIRHWGLPKEFAAIIRYYDDPARVTNTYLRKLVLVVAAGLEFAQKLPVPSMSGVSGRKTSGPSPLEQLAEMEELSVYVLRRFLEERMDEVREFIDACM
ncbi:HDOD domain-containing protein [Rhodocaloribacter sp.]